jgi:TM2 domain-containing membrane protein YozV
MLLCSVKKWITICLCCAMCAGLSAQNNSALPNWKGKILFHENSEGQYELRKAFAFLNKADSENPRLVAIALDISLGILGVHRLYLGTDLKIPVMYTLTLGGGGVLWLVDLGLLIATKDISKYYDNPRLFMWTK